MQQAIKPIATVLNETYKRQLATNEYLLILNPHEELRNKVQQVKKEFYDAYQAPTALGGKPYNISFTHVGGCYTSNPKRGTGLRRR